MISPGPLHALKAFEFPRTPYTGSSVFREDGLAEAHFPRMEDTGSSVSENLRSRKLRSSEGRLLFLFAHYQNRAVCVSDDAIGYTPHQRSSYSGAAAAAYYYQTRSYFLG